MGAGGDLGDDAAIRPVRRLLARPADARGCAGPTSTRAAAVSSQLEFDAEDQAHRGLPCHSPSALAQARYGPPPPHRHPRLAARARPGAAWWRTRCAPRTAGTRRDRDRPDHHHRRRDPGPRRSPRSAARRCGPRSSTRASPTAAPISRVHSMKDVETIRPRAVRDRRHAGAGRHARPADRRRQPRRRCREGARVGTSSPRRTAQLLRAAARPAMRRRSAATSQTRLAKIAARRGRRDPARRGRARPARHRRSARRSTCCRRRRRARSASRSCADARRSARPARGDRPSADPRGGRRPSAPSSPRSAAIAIQRRRRARRRADRVRAEILSADGREVQARRRRARGTGRAALLAEASPALRAMFGAMKLLILRPQPGADETRGAGPRAGAGAGRRAAFRGRARSPGRRPIPAGFDAVMLTSANAARLRRRRRCAPFTPCPAMRSARRPRRPRARPASPTSGPAPTDGAALAATMAERTARASLLHLCGRDHLALASPGRDRRMSRSMPPRRPARLPARAAGDAVALLHSPRAAALFAGAGGRPRARSASPRSAPRTARAAGEGWRAGRDRRRARATRPCWSLPPSCARQADAMNGDYDPVDTYGAPPRRRAWLRALILPGRRLPARSRRDGLSARPLGGRRPRARHRRRRRRRLAEPAPPPQPHRRRSCSAPVLQPPPAAEPAQHAGEPELARRRRRARAADRQRRHPVARRGRQCRPRRGPARRLRRPPRARPRRRPRLPRVHAAAALRPDQPRRSAGSSPPRTIR